MVLQDISLGALRGRAASAGAAFCRAAARLRRSLQRTKPKHNTRLVIPEHTTPTLAEYLEMASDLRAETLSKEIAYSDSLLALIAEAEDKYKADEAQISKLSEEIQTLKDTLKQLRKKTKSKRRLSIASCGGPIKLEEASMKAKLESLEASVALKASEVVAERSRADRLRRESRDLPAALQRARAAQASTDALLAELQRTFIERAARSQKTDEEHV